jgi:hypothetical protein
VQSRQVVRHCECPQPMRIVCLLGADESDRDEQGDLDDVGFFVAKGEQERIREVIEGDRRQGHGHAASPAGRSAGNEDRQVIQMLNRGRRREAIQHERQEQCAQHDRPGRGAWDIRRRLATNGWRDEWLAREHFVNGRHQIHDEPVLDDEADRAEG